MALQTFMVPLTLSYPARLPQKPTTAIHLLPLDSIVKLLGNDSRRVRRLQGNARRRPEHRVELSNIVVVVEGRGIRRVLANFGQKRMHSSFICVLFIFRSVLRIS